MRYLSLVEVLELHGAIITSTGGVLGIRDIGVLESAVNQPRLTFDQMISIPILFLKQRLFVSLLSWAIPSLMEIRGLAMRQ